MINSLLLIFLGVTFSTHASTQFETKPLHYMNEATVELQAAAKAVVLIETVEGAGSGFFISEDGLLMTNRHVAAPEECPKNGCFMTLRRNFKSLEEEKPGEKSETALFFVTPVIAVPELDIALLQVWNAPPKKGEEKPKEKFLSKSFLKIGKHPKLDESIYTVAHPSAGLQRWTEGKYLYSRGDWRGAEILVMPGMSGSPVLNEKGEAIGIWHRSSNDGNSVLKFDKLHTVGYYTDLSALNRFWKKDEPVKDLLEGYYSFPTGEKISADAFVEFISEVEGFGKLSNLMLSRRTNGFALEDGEKKSKKKDLKKWSIKEEILGACEDDAEDEAGLLDPDFSYPHCEMALHWMDCGADTENTVPIQGVPESERKNWNFKFCPGEEDQKKWTELFQKIEEDLELKNQEVISWIARTAGVFQQTPEKATDVIKKRLQEYVKARPDMSLFEKALATSHWAKDLEAEITPDWNLKKLVTQYDQAFGYRLFYEELLLIHEAILSRKLVDWEQAKSLAKPYFEDASVPVILKIDLETLLAKSSIRPQ